MAHQNVGHLGPGEFLGQLLAGSQHLPYLGAGQDDEILRGVIGGVAHHHHPAQFPGEGGVVGLEDLDLQGVGVADVCAGAKRERP